jgi:putative phage-type endonuclease
MNNSLIQGSQEWKALRQTKVGASDASAILGLSKWATPFQLWEQKLGLKEVEMTSAMYRGHELEEEARREFEHLHGVTVFPDVVFHPEYEWMMASLDGIDIEKKTLVEIKCINRNDHQTALDGKVPDHYFPQCQHQLAVTGLPFMYYFSYDPLNPATVIVPRDDVYIADMIDREKEFYRCMTEFDPPPLTDKDYVDMSGDAMWAINATAYRMAMDKRKAYEEAENSLRKILIDMADGKNSKGCGIKMTRIVRKGNIAYDKVPELQGIDLEPYRKSPIESWRIGEHDA